MLCINLLFFILFLHQRREVRAKWRTARLDGAEALKHFLAREQRQLAAEIDAHNSEPMSERGTDPDREKRADIVASTANESSGKIEEGIPHTADKGFDDRSSESLGVEHLESQNENQDHQEEIKQNDEAGVAERKLVPHLQHDVVKSQQTPTALLIPSSVITGSPLSPPALPYPSTPAMSVSNTTPANIPSTTPFASVTQSRRAWGAAQDPVRPAGLSRRSEPSVKDLVGGPLKSSRVYVDIFSMAVFEDLVAI